uniref:Uncharacterized protein n=1 Tax=Physcomitrium patens TaxID=3218 RepID=A0A2K1KFC6_PHYPA|nr:hypothetical protein PHYPA_008858 [Physcomitrium patens]
MRRRAACCTRPAALVARSTWRDLSCIILPWGKLVLGDGVAFSSPPLLQSAPNSSLR